MPIQERSVKHPRPITVKVMTRMPWELTINLFGRQLPQADRTWGRCHFVFDPEADYDWLVVYHDIYRPSGKPGLERLRCSREMTILVTTEPSIITVYGTDYLRQFGTVITSQEPWAVKHANAIFSQPGLVWFYGVPFECGKLLTDFDHDRLLSYDDLKAMPPALKNKSISTICSNRRGWLTLHTRRVDFTHRMLEVIPELDVFGLGVRPMSDKAEALDLYRHHIAIENHVYPHHLTEKLPDAFLGYTLPFYHGCPNAADYFPPESFIPIDIRDFGRTLEIIRGTIANNEYQDRLPYIIEARRRVLEEYNLFAVLARYIGDNDRNSHGRSACGPAEVIMTRQTLRIRKPAAGLRSLLEKGMTKGKHHWLRLLGS